MRRTCGTHSKDSFMKCFLIVNKSESVLTFRRTLISHLEENGYAVTVVAQDNERETDIAKLGVPFYCVAQDNRGLNPFSILRYWHQIRRILKEEKPDVVFTFQLKANTFGVYGAKTAGVGRVFSMVEGAGDVFIKQSAMWKALRAVICLLYRVAFSQVERVIFLNKEDQAEFLKRKILKEEKSFVIPGIGVDLERFAQKPLKNGKNFLMVARLHKEKGVFEYCECARQVKAKYPEAQFDYLGPEREITVADIQSYIDDGSIRYLGAVHDVRPYLEDCTILILPSYREGMPMSIMEAEAVGRGIITFDTIGCRDTVVDGYNGFLLKPKDVEAMVEKCCYILEHPEEAVRMGENSRRFAQERFDQNKINRMLLEIMEQC